MTNSKLARPGADQLSGKTFDVVIIGGGITGAGIALDAASRGLSVALFEKGDFASGTSSKSTKLIHGGLRYLANGQFGVVLESVRERKLQQKLAPHMVWSLPFVIPTYRGKFFKNMKLRAGLFLYDLMAGSEHKFTTRISRDEVIARCPGVKTQGLTGGYLFSDCRTDDARHTLEVLKAAVAHGAVVMNYARVNGFIRERNRVVGVEVVDVADRALALVRGDSPGMKVPPYGPETSMEPKPFEVRGRCVVNATGVWTQKTQELSGGRARTTVVPAKGIHIVLPKSRLPIDCAMIIDSVHDKRFCFAVPWYDSVIIGTTDTEYTGDLDKITVEPDEVKYVLDAVNALFPAAKITEKDVAGSYAGLRPLIKPANTGAGATNKLSREHHLEAGLDGLVTIAGGKLTTYRPMAEEVVDLVLWQISGDVPGFTAGPCKTGEIVLSGFTARDDVSGWTRSFIERAMALGLTRETAEYLPSAYGKNADEVLSIVSENNKKFADKIHPDHPYILAQVVYACRNEQAVTIDDVLSRRIRLTITDRKAANLSASKISHVMAAELGWHQVERVAQVLEFGRS